MTGRKGFYARFREMQNKVNEVLAWMFGAVLQHGTLAIDATAEKWKTTTAFIWRDSVTGVQYTSAAEIELVFTAAHTITASKFGVILLQTTKAGVKSTKVVASPQAYDTAALALAAKPAPDAGNVELGYIAIANNAGDWVGNTDDLTNASDVTTAAFVNATVATVPVALTVP